MLQQRAGLMTGVNTALLTAVVFIPACRVAYIDLMTSDNTARRDVQALTALAARLHHALNWRPVAGPGLLVENDVTDTRTVVTVVDEQYAVDIAPGQPSARLAAVTDPDAAAASLSERLAVAAGSAPGGERFYQDGFANVQAGSLKAMGVW